MKSMKRVRDLSFAELCTCVVVYSHSHGYLTNQPSLGSKVCAFGTSHGYCDQGVLLLKDAHRQSESVSGYTDC